MKPLELFIISLDHPSNSCGSPSSLGGREDAYVACGWTLEGSKSNFQVYCDSVAAVAATGVAGDVTEGKCSAVEEMQQERDSWVEGFPMEEQPEV